MVGGNKAHSQGNTRATREHVNVATKSLTIVPGNKSLFSLYLLFLTLSFSPLTQANEG